MTEELQKETTEQVETETKDVDVETMLKRVEQLEQTNQRLLVESKEYKNKYKEVQTKVEQDQKIKLEESENWKELLEIEKNNAHKVKEDYQSLKKQALKKELNFQVAKYASDAYDVDDIIKVIPHDMISIDQESLQISGVSDAISLLKEKKAHLFNTAKKSGMGGNRPNGEVETKNTNELGDDDFATLFGNMPSS